MAKKRDREAKTHPVSRSFFVCIFTGRFSRLKTFIMDKNNTPSQIISVAAKDVGGIIWDLDNTLYRLDDAIKQAFNIAIARVAVDAGVPLSLKDATARARSSYEEYGFSGQFFINEYGLDRKQLHIDYHGYIDEKLIEDTSLEAVLFSKIRVPMTIVTHGSRDWARRVLRHLGLIDFFPDTHIFGLEDYDFQHKHASDMPFIRACDLMGCKTEETLVVEDTIVNLEIPHRLGMLTAYITHGRKAKLPDYVSLVFPNTLALITYLTADQD